MKKLIWDDDVEEVDLGDGDFISIGASLSIRDMAAVGAGENQVEISLALLQRLIRSWRGPSFERNGEPVSVTAENVGRLDMATASMLSERLASRVTRDRMDEETKKESIEISLPTSTIP